MTQHCQSFLSMTPDPPRFSGSHLSGISGCWPLNSESLTYSCFFFFFALLLSLLLCALTCVLCFSVSLHLSWSVLSFVGIYLPWAPLPMVINKCGCLLLTTLCKVSNFSLLYTRSQTIIGPFLCNRISDRAKPLPYWKRSGSKRKKEGVEVPLSPSRIKSQPPVTWRPLTSPHLLKVPHLPNIAALETNFNTWAFGQTFQIQTIPVNFSFGLINWFQ